MGRRLEKPRRTPAHLWALLLPALASTCFLQGCLTQALWDIDEEAPRLVETTHACKVHEVRGRLHHGSRDNKLCVVFSAQQTAYTPEHLRTYTEKTPGVLKLVPPERGDGDWLSLPGAALFQPEGWHLRVKRGEHFHVKRANARLLFWGTLAPAQVCEVLPAHRVATSIREQTPMPTPEANSGVLDRCLQAFHKRQWIRLATGERRWARGYTQEALAFVDANGKLVSRQALESRAGDPAVHGNVLADYALVARLDGPFQGDDRYVRIPLAVLMQGKNLDLRRVGNAVRWERSQVWHGETAQEKPGTDELAKLQLPLDLRAFAYVQVREVEDANLLPTFLRVLLTPAAVVGDYVLVHSIWARELARWFREGRWAGPFGGKKKNN